MDMPNMGLSHNLRRDLQRALRSHKYEVMDDGRILVASAKAAIGGVFDVDVNGRDRIISPNLLSTEGLVDILKVYFQLSAQRTAFYLAPFAGAADPTNALTAANFAATQTEFVNYSEGSRPAWTPPGTAITTASIDNTASPGVCTINADNKTVWGFAMIAGASAKSATTGALVACTKFATAKSGLMTGDVLNAKYTFTAADAA